MKQADLIHNTGWKFLVVLDACTYKPFNKLYPCKKTISPATWTLEWLNKMWPDYYDDIVYISGNIYCLNQSITKHHRYGGRYSYEGSKHFFKVVEVCNKGWSKKYGTVLPIEINKAFSREYLRNPQKRFILHYMQPHRPYITLDGKEKKKTVTQRMSKHMGGKSGRHRLMGYIPERFKWVIGDAIGKEQPPYAYVWMKEGYPGLRRVYSDEIKNVMDKVAMLTESIDGKWVITADHGERITHPLLDGHGGRRDKDVIEVPWLEVGK